MGIPRVCAVRHGCGIDDKIVPRETVTDMQTIDPRSLMLRLFLPFAAGYFLSYLYRTVNAVLGPVIAGELALPDNALGLLTSTYFLAFGAAQLPLGMLLDRFGPRRVEAGLLMIAALGAAVFAFADGLTGLTLGRALIGLGVSACLMASFKAFIQWFPPERQASLTGWIMASGGLGALAAAKPLEIALGFAGWREIILALAVVTLLVAGALWYFVPDKPGQPAGAGFSEQLAGVRQIFASRHFWRYAPLGFCFTGGFMAVQGLWASRWMNVMESLDAAAVAARPNLDGRGHARRFPVHGIFRHRAGTPGHFTRQAVPFGDVCRLCRLLGDLPATAMGRRLAVAAARCLLLAVQHCLFAGFPGFPAELVGPRQYRAEPAGLRRGLRPAMGHRHPGRCPAGRWLEHCQRLPGRILRTARRSVAVAHLVPVARAAALRSPDQPVA
jgi:MFS family permease